MNIISNFPRAVKVPGGQFVPLVITVTPTPRGAHIGKRGVGACMPTEERALAVAQAYIERLK